MNGHSMNLGTALLIKQAAGYYTYSHKDSGRTYQIRQAGKGKGWQWSADFDPCLSGSGRSLSDCSGEISQQERDRYRAEQAEQDEQAWQAGQARQAARQARIEQASQQQAEQPADLAGLAAEQDRAARIWQQAEQARKTAQQDGQAADRIVRLLVAEQAAKQAGIAAALALQAAAKQAEQAAAEQAEQARQAEDGQAARQAEQARQAADRLAADAWILLDYAEQSSQQADEQDEQPEQAEQQAEQDSPAEQQAIHQGEQPQPEQGEQAEQPIPAGPADKDNMRQAEQDRQAWQDACKLINVGQGEYRVILWAGGQPGRVHKAGRAWQHSRSADTFGSRAAAVAGLIEAYRAEQAEQASQPEQAASQPKQDKQAARLAARKIRIEQAEQDEQAARLAARQAEQAAEQARQQAAAYRPVYRVISRYSLINGSSRTAARQASSQQQAERWIRWMAATAALSGWQDARIVLSAAVPEQQPCQPISLPAWASLSADEQAARQQQIDQAAARIASRTAAEQARQAAAAADQAGQAEQPVRTERAGRLAWLRLAHSTAEQATRNPGSSPADRQQASEQAARLARLIAAEQAKQERLSAARRAQDRAGRDWQAAQIELWQAAAERNTGRLPAAKQAEQQPDRLAVQTGPERRSLRYGRQSASRLQTVRHEAYRPAVAATQDRNAISLKDKIGRTVRTIITSRPTVRKAGSQPTAGTAVVPAYRPSRPNRQPKGYVPGTAAMLVSSQTAAAALQAVKDGRPAPVMVGTATAAAMQEAIRSGRIPLAGGQTQIVERTRLETQPDGSQIEVIEQVEIPVRIESYTTIRNVDGIRQYQPDVWACPFESRDSRQPVLPGRLAAALPAGEQASQQIDHWIGLAEQAEQAEQARQQAEQDRAALLAGLDSQIGSHSQQARLLTDRQQAEQARIYAAKQAEQQAGKAGR